jgi:hypothetical protein
MQREHKKTRRKYLKLMNRPRNIIAKKDTSPLNIETENLTESENIKSVYSPPPPKNKPKIRPEQKPTRSNRSILLLFFTG